jgi:hypothetical protein
MSEAIVITASPVLDTDSRRACSGRGQLFDGLFEGRLIITRSSQPLLDRARALLAKGIDPRTRILMRHVGADADALRSTVGRAAKLSIREGDDAPRFKDWVPLSPRPGAAPCVKANWLLSRPSKTARQLPRLCRRLYRRRNDHGASGKRSPSPRT